jgi:pimeloyl-ACP methyl ester carboxylesterase
MSSRSQVVFSHGLDSSPFSLKIRSLYEIAEAMHFEVSAVDYRGISDPAERVQMLVEFCRDYTGHLVLVGSSLGAYVSLAAAIPLHAKGVFMMAPALTAPGIPPLKRGLPSCPLAIIHGWRDEVIPYEDSLRFARDNKLTLHMVESDHGLASAVPFLKVCFHQFLIATQSAQHIY